MTDAAPGTVGGTFAKGVLDDVAELTATTAESNPRSFSCEMGHHAGSC